MSEKAAKAEIKLLKQTIQRLTSLCHSAYWEGVTDHASGPNPYRSGTYGMGGDRYQRELEEILANKNPEDPEPQRKPEPPGLRCRHCGGTAKMKDGRYGRFVACDNYRICKKTRPQMDPRDWDNNWDEDTWLDMPH